MGDLIKQIIPSVPPVGSTPATAGTAPHPAYCIDITSTSEVTIEGQWVFIEDSLGNIVGSFYFPGHTETRTTTETTCYGASAGSPGSPGTPATPRIPADFQEGWNAGAESVGVLEEDVDGYYTFTVPRTSVGVVTGFNTAQEGQGFEEINHAFYVFTGRYQVMEHGTPKTDTEFYSSDDDVFTIRRMSGRFRYYVNDELIYVSEAEPLTERIFVDASLYMGGDEITGAELTEGGANDGEVEGIIGPITGWGSTDGGPDVHGLLGQLDGDFEVANSGGVTGIIGPVKGAARDSTAGCITEGLLGDILGDASGDSLEPDHAEVDGLLQSLQGFSIGELPPSGIGEVEGIIGPLYNYAANFEYCDTRGLLGQVQLYGGLVNVRGDGVFTAPRRYGFFATGHQPNVSPGFRGELSGYSFTARGGAYARMALTGYSFTGEGKAAVYAVARTRLSGYSLTATGTARIMGRGTFAYTGDYSVSARGGGIARGELSGYSVQGSGIGGAVGRMARTGPRPYSLTAAATIHNFGSVIATLPTLQPGNSGIAIMTGPRYLVRGTGYEVLSVEYEAYSITLTRTDQGEQTAVSHYTNFPFDRIVRFGNKHYGVAPDGLYELTGDTWDGEPITSVFQTSMHDLGAPQLKRASAMYMTGRVGADFDVTVLTDETSEDGYQYRPRKTPVAITQRVLLGKGIRGHYFAYRFENTEGDDFSLDYIAPELAVTGRNL